MKQLRLVAVLVAALLSSGCSDWHYESTESGTLKGKLIVEWIDQDTFIFLPDAADPLTFVRSNKEVIRPQRMLTDGGSIPRALRVIKSYSPWGYAPAFIIHDWLYQMKHCKLPGYDKLSVELAATIMSEVIKTIMENPKHGGKHSLILYSMYQAVKTDAAQTYWDSGKCSQAEEARSLRRLEVGKPRARFVIKFP